jgi:hypothetical protein
MEYLRELIERLGKALGIKAGARQTQNAAAPADPLEPVEGTAPQVRP